MDAATELGVGGMIPIRTMRGVAQPTESALERLRRAVIEASKQSGRNKLMEISEPQTVIELVGHASAESEDDTPREALRLVAHPYDLFGPRAALSDLLSQPQRGAILAIGPEGGFTREEIEQFHASRWQVVDLGKTILRVEVAAIAAAAQLAAWISAQEKRST